MRSNAMDDGPDGDTLGFKQCSQEGGRDGMVELFLQISVSLDGYIEDRNGDIEWMTSAPRLTPSRPRR